MNSINWDKERSWQTEMNESGEEKIKGAPCDPDLNLVQNSGCCWFNNSVLDN